MELVDAAGQALDWIASVATAAEGGHAWLEDGDLADNLYSGTAGILLGCAEAEAAGLDTTRVATVARARLLHLAERGQDVASLPDDGLFTGWAGVAEALRAWSRVTAANGATPETGTPADTDGDTAVAGATAHADTGTVTDIAAAAAAARLTSQLAGRVLDQTPDSPPCTDITSGDAGTLLALLADDADIAARAAGLLADRLAAAAEPAEGGLQWRMNADWAHLMPGFSHGTAGVAYALAAAARRTCHPSPASCRAQPASSAGWRGSTPCTPAQRPPAPRPAPPPRGSDRLTPPAEGCCPQTVPPQTMTPVTAISPSNL
jgi:hypothetical protein